MTGGFTLRLGLPTQDGVLILRLRVVQFDWGLYILSRGCIFRLVCIARLGPVHSSCMLHAHTGTVHSSWGLHKHGWNCTLRPAAVHSEWELHTQAGTTPIIKCCTFRLEATHLEWLFTPMGGLYTQTGGYTFFPGAAN